jgi:hypothetical protein
VWARRSSWATRSLGGAGGVAAAVVVRAEVVVELAVGEHVPNGDEHRVEFPRFRGHLTAEPSAR